MTQPDTEHVSEEAEQFYLRGIAAARGDKNMVAATLLRQALKLNPQHEQAWLWLSEVLSDPEDITFCLRAALDINPENRHAQRGLEWLAQHGSKPRSLLNEKKPHSTLVTSDPWWTAYRAVQAVWCWAIRVLLLIPVVLIAATLCIRTAILFQPLPVFNSDADMLQVAQVEQASSFATPSTSTAMTRMSSSAYFHTLDKERRALKKATQAYHDAAASGRMTNNLEAATKQLRDQVAQSHTALASLQSPVGLATAHEYYLAGLALEQAGLDRLLAFYQSNDATVANQAAMQLQQARSHIATAKANWDAYREQHHTRPQAAGAH
jgi:hypothetical protein